MPDINTGILAKKAKKKKEPYYDAMDLAPGKSRAARSTIISGLGVGSALNTHMRMNATGSIRSTANAGKKKYHLTEGGVSGALNKLQSMVTQRGVGTTLNGVARERRFGTYQSPGGM